MNCSEAQAWLQRHLDGETVTRSASLHAHLAACSTCREQFAAAERLMVGLRLFRSPTPPLGLAERIVVRITQAQRHRLRFRVAISVGLAASLFLALGLWFSIRPSTSTPSEVVVGVPKPAAPQVRKQFDEASQAVVALTRRTTEETVGPTRLLMPDLPLPNAAALAPGARHDPQAAEKSLRDMGQSVTAGFAPVTSSARRAVSMFLREVPATKSGS